MLTLFNILYFSRRQSTEKMARATYTQRFTLTIFNSNVIFAMKNAIQGFVWDSVHTIHDVLFKCDLLPLTNAIQGLVWDSVHTLFTTCYQWYGALTVRVQQKNPTFGMLGGKMPSWKINSLRLHTHAHNLSF